MSRITVGADGLTDIERRFVQECTVSPAEPGDALKRATGGNVEKKWSQLAYQMMKRPHVRAAYDAELAKLAKKTGRTAEAVLADIDRIAKKAEAAKDWGAALKGRELEGKHLKLFTEKHEHAGPGGGPILTATIDPTKLTPEQLRAIASIRVDGE